MVDDDGVVLADNELALVRELRETRQWKRKLEARENELRKTLLEKVGDRDRGLTAAGATVLQVQRQHRTGVDRKRLEALYPEVYEDVCTESEVVVLKTPEDEPASVEDIVW